MVQKLIVVGVVVTLLATVSAFAAKYKCEGVESIARLGVGDGARVTWEEGAKDDETKGKYCAFSINGVAASSPPLQRVRDALERLIQRNHDDNSKLFAIDVAYALIAAGRLAKPSDDLSKYLQSHSVALNECFRRFRNRTPMEKARLFSANSSSRFNGLCFFTTWREYHLEQSASLKSIAVYPSGNTRRPRNVEQGRPHLVVGVGENQVRRWFFQPVRG